MSDQDCDATMLFSTEKPGFQGLVLKTYREGLQGSFSFSMANTQRLDLHIELLSVHHGSRVESTICQKHSEGSNWFRVVWIDNAQVAQRLVVYCPAEITFVKLVMSGCAAISHDFHLIDQEQAVAELLFDLAQGEWAEYCRLFCIFTQPQVSNESIAELRTLLQKYFRLVSSVLLEEQVEAASKLVLEMYRRRCLKPYPPARQPTLSVIQDREATVCSSSQGYLENCLQIGTYLIASGWLRNDTCESLTYWAGCSTDSHLLDVTHLIAKCRRKDVEDAFGVVFSGDLSKAFGFSICLDLSLFAFEEQSSLNLYCVRERRVDVFNLQIREHLPVGMAALERLVGVAGVALPRRETCEKFFQPVFTSIAEAGCSEPIHPDCIWFNIKQSKPTALSVIIPLHGPVRFEIAQMASIAALRFPGVELIFAVDDPSIHSTVLSNVKRQSELYGLKTAVVFPGRNLGFSGINNFAAAYASSEVLLFLNSDCFFTRASSLFKALSAVQMPSIGAIGFRLLYPDGLVQHDGMANDLWIEDTEYIINLHPGIGSKPSGRPTKSNLAVSLLTAACLMMRKSVFDRVGGFNRAYLRGDFEDSDLCLKLIVSGYRLALIRSEDIYHLERQSIAHQNSSTRQAITLFNSYLYGQRWGNTIQAGLPTLETIQ